jgi:hypothetical protein
VSRFSGVDPQRETPPLQQPFPKRIFFIPSPIFAENMGQSPIFFLTKQRWMSNLVCV